MTQHPCHFPIRCDGTARSPAKTSASPFRRLSWYGVALALLISSAGYAPVSSAAVCNFAANDKNGCDLGNTGWKASWTSDDIKLRFQDQVVGNNEGILTKQVIFNSMNALTIKFEQVTFNPNAPSNNNFGLRFTMNEVISNKSGFDWGGFLIELKDIDSFFARNTADHPNAAHMHPDDRTVADKKGYSVPPFTKVKDKDGNIKDTFVATSNFDLDGLLSLNVSNGKFANGTMNVNWNGIGIHDWEMQGTAQLPKLRSFNMIERPIPLPATLSLLGLGLAGLAWSRRKS